MFGFVSKIFGGSKSEKDAKKLEPTILKVNQFFTEYQSLSNDQLRSKTNEFKKRIQEHLSAIDKQIIELNEKADGLSHTELIEKDNNISIDPKYLYISNEILINFIGE